MTAATPRDPPPVVVRQAHPADWPAIWPFFAEITAAQETFAYAPDLPEAAARALWMVGPPGRTTVAVDEDHTILGSANMYANRPGPGSHVASASFMVSPSHEGRGVGRRLVEDALDWARGAGFAAMQFNAVVETNVRAVALYQRLGFAIVGTVPGAYRHPRLGDVGLHVMHRWL